MLAERTTRVLKQDETFAISDRYGDIQSVTQVELSACHMGTRHLSMMTFMVNDDTRPLLLNSALRDDNGF